MKEKQVPEDQMKFLRNKLIGNEAFGRIRGLLPYELGVLGTILAASESPTDFCRRWDQFSSDARVIGNLLACCQRDGLNEAVKELTNALNDKTYRLPGETVPLHETEPYTVVVFDFPRTLTMIRWIRCAHWSSLNTYLKKIDNRWDRSEWLHSQDREFTQALFDAFPNLLQHTRERRARGDYEGWDLLKSYREHVLDGFDHEQLHEIGHSLHLAYYTYNDHLEIRHNVFGYLVREDQGRLLARFTREQQKRITTWTVHLPKVFAESNKTNLLLVGFHPEQSHQDWEKVSNSYASPGCSCKYGAVIMNRQYAHPLDDHTCRYHKDVSISNVSLRETSEQLAFELSIC